MLRILFILLFIHQLCAAQQQTCAIAFYNTENLFDTLNDQLKDDDDFTPAGAYHYTGDIYRQKLHNIARVINELHASVIGLAEVENGKVLNDLVSQPVLKGKYQYIWFDSPDPRGIDVALLYMPGHFKVLHKEARKIVLSDGELTRDILYVKGLLDNDTVDILVNHWPSRREGQKETAAKRAEAALQNRQLIERIWACNPHSKIIVIGDLNDNPVDESVASVLDAKTDKATAGERWLYNPWAGMYNNGKGTLVFHKHWDLFDHIIVSNAFMQRGPGWRFEKAEIFSKEFLTTWSGKQQGTPYRAWRGNYWMNGYSDHFPVVIYLSK